MLLIHAMTWWNRICSNSMLSAVGIKECVEYSYANVGCVPCRRYCILIHVFKVVAHLPGLGCDHWDRGSCEAMMP